MHACMYACMYVCECGRAYVNMLQSGVLCTLRQCHEAPFRSCFLTVLPPSSVALQLVRFTASGRCVKSAVSGFGGVSTPTRRDNDEIFLTGQCDHRADSEGPWTLCFRIPVPTSKTRMQQVLSLPSLVKLP